MRAIQGNLVDHGNNIYNHLESMKGVTGDAFKILGAMSVTKNQLSGTSEIIENISKAIEKAHSHNVISQVVNIKGDLTSSLSYVVSTIEKLEKDFNSTIVTFSEIAEDIKLFQQIYTDYFMAQGISVALVLVGILIAIKIISIMYRAFTLCSGEVSFLKKNLIFRRSIRVAQEGGD